MSNLESLGWYISKKTHWTMISYNILNGVKLVQKLAEKSPKIA